MRKKVTHIAITNLRVLEIIEMEYWNKNSETVE